MALPDMKRVCTLCEVACMTWSATVSVSFMTSFPTCLPLTTSYLIVSWHSSSTLILVLISRKVTFAAVCAVWGSWDGFVLNQINYPNLIWFLFLTCRGCSSVHKPCRRLVAPGWDGHSLKPRGIQLPTLRRWASNYWIMHRRLPLSTVQPSSKN